MYISKLEDLVYKYQFDSFEDSFVFVNYNFSFNVDNVLDTEDYDIDIQSITAGDSGTDLQFIIDSKIYDKIINRLIDTQQNHISANWDDDYA